MRGLLLLIFLATSAGAQPALQQQIRGIAADARGKVAVACSLPGTGLNCDVDAAAHPPMQSVFKLPLAVAILHQVEQGKLSLDQAIPFRREDRFLPHAYSPLQDKFPEAGVEVPLRELLRLSVSLSDNAAADILLRVAGGPAGVSAYIASLGVRGFQLEDDEHALHREVEAQYRNWFAPAAAVQFLRRLSDRSPLTPADTELLLGWMGSTMTTRLKMNLPAGTAVAHKSGTSDVDAGLAHATNDIGLITLPDGRKLAIAVFVTDSRADEATREQVIARIARAAYDAALALPANAYNRRMPNRTDQAIESGARRVEESEHLAGGLAAPRDVSLAEIAEQDGPDGAPLKTALAELTLSMFTQGASTRVRVGNPHNSSELYEHAFDSPDEANSAMLDAGILTAAQVPDSAAPAGTGIVLTGITVEQLEAAGLKRHGASTL